MSRVQQVGKCGNCGGAVVLDHETFEGWGGSWKEPALRCVKCGGLARWPVMEMRDRRRRDRLDRIPAAKAEEPVGLGAFDKDSDSDGGSRAPREAGKP